MHPDVDDLDLLHTWRLLGAREKANSVMVLTQGIAIESVLEIGAGTGAVLETLDERGFAAEYYAVEPSERLCRFIRERGVVTRLAAVDACTIEQSELRKRSYDLVLLSHVLEHVERPEALLRTALGLGTNVIAEVPLEGSLGASARAALKVAVTRTARSANPAGHVRFYSRGSFMSLVARAGGHVLRSRIYVPRETMAFARRRNGSRPDRLFARAVSIASRLAGDRLWSAIYHGHYAVLARRRT
jgi:SAM-dependent methyltransferase